MAIIIKMESNDKLKEYDIKNPTCYYFDNIIKIKILILSIFYLKNHTKIF